MNSILNETINQTINQTANVTSTVAPNLFGLVVPITGSVTLDIYLISLIASLFITLVNKYIGDQAKIKALKAEMKEMRKKQKDIMKEKDPKKMQEFQQKMMAKSMENMKHSMNPKIMLTTMIPMLLLFGAVRVAYGSFGEFLDLGFTQFGWFGTYFCFSIINSILLKKLLDVA